MTPARFEAGISNLHPGSAARHPRPAQEGHAGTGQGARQIIVSASADELRLVLTSLKEVLNRRYAVPDDDGAT